MNSFSQDTTRSELWTSALVSNHLWEQEDPESACNENSSHTTQTFTHAHLPVDDLGEEGTGDVPMTKKLGGAVELTRGSCTGRERPDPSRQVNTQHGVPRLCSPFLPSRAQGTHGHATHEQQRSLPC